MYKMTFKPLVKTKMFTILLFMTVLWGKTKPQSCPSGCYHCETIDEETNCLICDFENSFVLDQDGSSCTKREISGCQVVSSDGFLKSCLKCDSGKVFDQNADSCVSVPSSSQIDNCGEYESNSLSCLSCKSGYYLRAGECVSLPEDTIDNCAKFLGPYECEECQDDYYLDGFSCKKVPQIPGCKSYSSFQCQNCSEDSKYTPSFLEQLQLSSEFRDSLSMIKDQSASFKVNPISKLCLTTNIKGCSVFESLNRCKLCMKGYVSDGSGGCKLKPIPVIENCISYENFTDCQECEAGYYSFDSPSICVKRENEFDDCVEYDKLRDSCIQCKEGFYVSGNLNICQKREKSLDQTNCDSISATSDHCLTCKENYVRTNDLFNCLPLIDKCSGYDYSDYGADSHKCTACLENYYLNEEKTECKARSVENCKEYETDSFICKICEDNLYVDLGTNRCESITQVADCSEYVTNDNKCETCAKTHYLNEEETQCLLRNVTNCADYVTNKNECLQCDNLHYLVDSTTCSPITVGNCRESNGVDNECTTCLNLFQREDATTCSAITDTNCLESNGIDNECDECNNLFYKNNSICSLLNVSNCAKSNGIADTCLKCQNLKYLTNTPSCDDITNITDCQYSDGISNNCRVCNDGYKLDGEGTCQADASYTKPLPDSNCLEFSFDGSNHCKQCKTDYDLIEIKDYLYTEQEMKDMSCSKINSSTGFCQQCAPLSKGVSTGVCAQVPTPYEGLCYQLKEDTFTELEEPNSCDKCVDSLNTEDESTCELSEVKNLNSFETFFDSNYKCKKNEFLRYRTISSPVCTKKNTLNSNEGLRNCILFNKYTNLCYLCESGYELDANNKCSKIDFYTSFLLKEQTIKSQNVRIPIVSDSSKTGTETLSILSRFSVGKETIVSCLEGSAKIIDFSTNYLSSIRDDYVNIGTPYKPYKECFNFNLSSHSMFTNDDSFYRNLGKIKNCDIMRGDGGIRPMFCAQCKPGYMGKVFRIFQLNASAPISPHYFGIYFCKKVDDLDFDVGGLDYHRNDIITNDRLTSYISAGKCLNNKHLIYFMNVNDEGDVHNVELKVGDDPKTAERVLQYKCVDDLTNIDLTFKDNCQIFAYTPENEMISQDIYDNIPAQHCLACKPGFRAVLNTKNHITDCVQIEECDLSNPENNKMNACMTCTNKTWVFENGTIRFDKCAIESNNITRPLVEGCLYHDDSLLSEKPCRFCDRGYNVTNKGDCRKISDFDTCSKPSYGKMKSDKLDFLDGIGTSEGDSLSPLYFFYKYEDLMPVYDTALCLSCADDEILAFEIDQSIKECSSENYDINNIFSNCETGEAIPHGNKCSSCNEEYLLRKENNYCLQISADIPELNYVRFLESDILRNDRISCSEGYKLNVRFECEKDSCVRMNPYNECILYEKGFYSNNESSGQVEPSPNGSVEYSNLLHRERYFVTCEGNNFYKILRNDERTIISSKCQLLSLPQHILDRYQNEIIYFLLDANDPDSKLQLKVVKSSENENRIADAQDEDFHSLNSNSFCLQRNDLIIENCKIMYQGFCTECNSDYGLTSEGACVEQKENCLIHSPNGVCQECINSSYKLNFKFDCVASISVDNCNTHSNFNEKCKICEEGYFLTKEKKCQKYSVNCEMFVVDSDECAICEDHMYFIKGDEGECSEINRNNCDRCEYRDNPHCFKGYEREDFCKSCLITDTYLWHEETDCKPGAVSCFQCRPKKTDSNCAIPNLTTNGCLECSTGNYFHKSLNLCLAYSAKNCEIHDPFADRCMTCKEGLIIDQKNKNCVFKNYENCVTINTDLLECDTCPDGMVTDDIEGCIVQNVTNCTGSNLSSTENKCSACDDPASFFLDHNNNCLAYAPVANCGIYEDGNTNTKCILCEDDYYLDMPNNSCLPRTVDRDCSDHTDQAFDKDECIGCSNSAFILISKLKCEVLNCSNPTSCDNSTEYMDQETCQCVTRTNTTINFCLSLDQFADGCGQCSSDAYRTNNLSCVEYSNATNCNKSPTADECTSCDNFDTHFLNPDSKLCESRTLVNNCSEFSEDSDECLLCESTHFLADPTTCIIRTDSSSCDTNIRNIRQDTCSGCLGGIDSEFLNDTETSCTTRTNTSKGCLVYAKKEDKCEICLTNYLLNPTTFKCEFDSRSEQCKGFYNNADKNCFECPRNYHLSATNECLPNTDPNCLAYFENTNQCRVCSSRTSYGTFESESCMNDPDSCQACPLKNNSCYLTSYDNPNGQDCLNCMQGMWHNPDNKTCNDYTATNCFVFNGVRDECSVCNEGYMMIYQESEENNCEETKSCLKCVEKKPVLELVANCEFEDDRSSDCVKCEDGFYLKADSSTNCFSPISDCNECIARTVTDCNEYEIEKDECKSCHRATHYLEEKSGTCSQETPENCNKCIKGTAESCLSYKLNSNHCQDCEGDLIINPETHECYSYEFPNCEIKSLNSEGCIKCNEKFYYDSEEKKCIAVTEEERCTSYKADSDECNSCEEGYLLYLNDSSCQPLPTGQVSCATYNHDGICIECRDNKYLSDENTCVELETIEDPNCEYYTKDKKCSTCKSNYWLNIRTNKCIMVEALNCSTVKDPYTCESCISNHYLEQSELHANCIDSKISGCIIAGFDGSPLCLICEVDYYLSENKRECIEVQNKIENCDYYESEEHCDKCANEFYLSSDKKSCLELQTEAGPNCSIAKKSSTPVCDICDRGYYKDTNGSCIKCMKGCNFCDFSSPNTCIECALDYLLNEDKICVSKVVDNEGDTTDPNRPENVQILNVFMMLVMFVVAVNRLG